MTVIVSARQIQRAEAITKSNHSTLVHMKLLMSGDGAQGTDFSRKHWMSKPLPTKVATLSAFPHATGLTSVCQSQLC